MAIMTKGERDLYEQRVGSLLDEAQSDGVPVHIGTARSSWVHVGFLVHTVDDGTGRAVLVNTQSGERFTPRLREISLAVTIDGRCESRPARSGRSDQRRRDVSTALSGLASLLAEPDLSPADRARLEQLVGEIARFAA